MMNRRKALQLISGSAALVSGQLTSVQLANAVTRNDARLALVILRGGLDSLHALVPYDENRYYALRPNIAVARPGEIDGALDLNGRFGLHPSLQTFHQLFKQGQMLAIPAASTSYRRRSHFDAQNQLENGTDKPFGAASGWMNRALTQLGADTDRRIGLAVGTTPPLIMTGDALVRSWSPTTLPSVDDDFLERLLRSYEADPEMQAVLAAGIESKNMVMSSAPNKRSRRNQLNALTRVAGQMMSLSDGPRIAVFESYGWDTHTGQVGRLKRQLKDLDQGMMALKDALGDAWRSTAVLVVTEFGRTVAENGSRGTDHGVGSLALLVGGAINGGRVAGEWPGLSETALFEGRDLAVRTDYVSLFKGLLGEHLGLGDQQIAQQVFAGLDDIAPARDLIG